MTGTVKRSAAGDFPAGPAVKTPRFQCSGHRFDLWPGNEDPICLVVWPKNKNFSKKCSRSTLEKETLYFLKGNSELCDNCRFTRRDPKLYKEIIEEVPCTLRPVASSLHAASVSTVTLISLQSSRGVHEHSDIDHLQSSRGVREHSDIDHLQSSRGVREHSDIGHLQSSRSIREHSDIDHLQSSTRCP